jgi:hypothetical protein
MMTLTSRPGSVRAPPWVCVVALGSSMGTEERVNVGTTCIPLAARGDDVGLKLTITVGT